MLKLFINKSEKRKEGETLANLVEENLKTVWKQIEFACQALGRKKEVVKLLIATKQYRWKN